MKSICYLESDRIKDMLKNFLLTSLLLTFSNLFMTFAWYGHLKIKNDKMPVILIILMSWGIAFFEYCLQVPANRIGYKSFSAVQLKTMQEIITLLVFAIFSTFFLGEQIKWNHLVGFLFLILSGFFIFKKW